jgi:hypothetical protein
MVKILITLAIVFMTFTSIASADAWSDQQTAYANEIVGFRMMRTQMDLDGTLTCQQVDIIAHEIYRLCTLMGFPYSGFMCNIAVRNWNTVL